MIRFSVRRILLQLHTQIVRSVGIGKLGEGHAIVVFGPGATQGFWDIGDPASGRTMQSQQNLAAIRNGEAVGLQPKALR